MQAGIDIAREEKTVYSARSAAQGGVDLPKPQTRAGTPDDGAWIDESRRVLRLNNQFSADAWGVYAQDLVQVAPHWKLLGGLRYDSLDGAYDQFGIPNAAPGPLTTVNYRQKISEWSKRVGVLYQPDALQSFHFSYGTSFNTSGDAYSYNAQSANTPPEQSENIELGAKLDSSDRQWSTRLALFRSSKKNERNTDPDWEPPWRCAASPPWGSFQETCWSAVAFAEQWLLVANASDSHLYWLRCSSSFLKHHDRLRLPPCVRP